MKAQFEYINNHKTERLPGPERRSVRQVRTLPDWRDPLLHESGGSRYAGEAVPDEHEYGYGDTDLGADREPVFYRPPAGDYGDLPDPGRLRRSHEDRTETLINRGRHSVRRRRIPKAGKIVIAAGILGVFIAVLVAVLFRTGPSWPPSVAVVQSEIEKACQNPDVMSEPGQVNFACAKPTRQILWVFALMTSGNNPNFTDPRSGRKGLEPIAPTQGGEVAWSLNLHHPYNPFNPIDSLQVAARAINNIVGGATLTTASGSPTVQAGLESNPANCARYTGSPAVISHQGFPNVCADPVTSPDGLTALVANIYQQWVIGAAPQTAQDAAVLFENASNPGDPQVQQILKSLPASRF
ncbi:MAG: hypothetical protein JOY82_18745 [Streptosporangiaceae bacterium]|nr:hypothetical protein [Streptosporangiaceae bacterium]MBV9856523.1 hypothetical protein [Streptosporangiaceae bacterium]